MKWRIAWSALVIVVLVATVGITVTRDSSPEGAEIASTPTVETTAAPQTAPTVPQEDVDAFLATWSDAENAAAYEAFQAEQARLDAEAAAAAEAEAQRQAQAEYDATIAQGGSYVYTEGPNAGGTCVIPSYICQRESGGNYGAVNSSSGAGGMYQFMPSTWNAIAGQIAPEWIGVAPQNAPPEVQDQFAAHLWNGGAGCGHWSACQ